MAMNGNGGAVDFSAFIPVDTIEVEIKAPDGSPTGWTISLCDSSHPKAQAHLDEQARRRLRREAQIEAAQVNGRKFHSEERTPDESKLDNVRWLVSRVVGWTPVKLGIISPDLLHFSDENAVRVFMHPKMAFVLSQLLDVIVAEKSFMPRSAQTSVPSLSAPSPSLPESPTDSHPETI